GFPTAPMMQLSRGADKETGFSTAPMMQLSRGADKETGFPTVLSASFFHCPSHCIALTLSHFSVCSPSLSLFRVDSRSLSHCSVCSPPLSLTLVCVHPLSLSL